MIEVFVILSLLHHTHSTPLYRLEQKDPSPSAIEPIDVVQPLPTSRLPLPRDISPGVPAPIIEENTQLIEEDSVSTIAPIKTTQILPAEEIKQVLSIVDDFELEMPGDAKPREPLGAPHKLPGEMEVIKESPSVIDSTIKSAKSVTSSPEIAIPELIDKVVAKDSHEETPTDKEDPQTSQVESIDVELETLDTQKSQITVIEIPTAEKVEKATEKSKEEPCDTVKVSIKIIQPAVPGEMELIPWDEESLFRIAVYLLAIFTEPFEEEQSTWQKIIVGFRCVLRDCRQALPLRPTPRHSLDDDSFIIRKARDSHCPCYLLNE